MNGLIKVLLADDHPMFLEGVRNALRQFEHLHIVVECTDGHAVQAYIREHPVDVAVLDINMPGQSGLELSRSITRQYPHIKVVFLTMYHPAAIGSDTGFAPGLHSYVLKNSGSQVLHEAIQAAFAGQRYLDPRLRTAVSAFPDGAFALSVKLSSREKQIIRLIVEGLGNKEIADRLFLSELTIKTHRKNVYQKLGVNNVAGLVLAVQKMGIEL